MTHTPGPWTDAKRTIAELELNALGVGIARYNNVKVERLRGKFMWFINGNRASRADCQRHIAADLDESAIRAKAEGRS